MIATVVRRCSTRSCKGGRMRFTERWAKPNHPQIPASSTVLHLDFSARFSPSPLDTLGRTETHVSPSKHTMEVRSLDTLIAFVRTILRPCFCPGAAFRAPDSRPDNRRHPPAFARRLQAAHRNQHHRFGWQYHRRSRSNGPAPHATPASPRATLWCLAPTTARAT